MSTSAIEAVRAPARVDYGPEEAAFQAYLKDGERRAFELGNRGPIRFTADGSLHPDILDAYWRCGFYVFEGVVGEEELADVEADLFDVIDRLPTGQGSPVDAKGPARPRPRLRGPDPLLVQAPRRSLRRHRPRERPAPGQDDGTGSGPGCPERGGVPHPRVPPVLGSVRAALRPPRAPRGRGRGERR